MYCFRFFVKNRREILPLPFRQLHMTSGAGGARGDDGAVQCYTHVAKGKVATSIANIPLPLTIHICTQVYMRMHPAKCMVMWMAMAYIRTKWKFIQTNENNCCLRWLLYKYKYEWEFFSLNYLHYVNIPCWILLTIKSDPLKFSALFYRFWDQCNNSALPWLLQQTLTYHIPSLHSKAHKVLNIPGKAQKAQSSPSRCTSLTTEIYGWMVKRSGTERQQTMAAYLFETINSWLIENFSIRNSSQTKPIKLIKFDWESQKEAYVTAPGPPSAAMPSYTCIDGVMISINILKLDKFNLISEITV